MNGQFLYRYSAMILALILTVVFLYFAKPFLVPVCIAGLLAMLFLPLSRRLEKAGLHRGLASVISCLLVILILIAAGTALSLEVRNLATDMIRFQEQVTEAIQKLRAFIVSVLGLSLESQEALLTDQGSAEGNGGSSIFIGTLNYASTFIINILIVIIYTFFFLSMRGHLKKFIIMAVGEGSKENTEVIIRDISMVGQHYLRGISLMILSLWLMYGIGFSLIGVKYALFFAILCGLLELVPFIGNFTGTLLTVLMSISWGADNRLIMAILITYGTIQFIQSYFLEPLVVGSGVNLNPLFSIMALVGGEMIWGIPGMILALPLLGMLKIIFDHIESLKPYGFLIGRLSPRGTFTHRLKEIFHNRQKG